MEKSREELQALCEALLVRNAELQGKVEYLERTNGQLDDALASAGVATLFLDRQLNIKRFTPAMGAILDLLPSHIGRPLCLVARREDAPQLVRDAEAVLATLIPVERELPGPRGGCFFIRRTLPCRSTDGEVGGIVVTLTDVTELKLLQERTVHLASFPQLNPNPVLETDPSGRITFYNDATKRILRSVGMAEADARIFLPSDLLVILGNWDRTGEATLYREVTVGELVFAATVFLTPRFDAVRIYAYDITERSRMEQALRESQEHLQLFVAHAPVALAMFDADMRYLSASRRWLSDYGLPERDISGLSHYHLFPEITEEWREAHRRGLAGEVLRAEAERFERADGSVQWIRWEIRPWHRANGEIGGIIIFTEDLAGVKEAEEALRRYQLLAERSRDILLYVRRDNGRILEANAAAVSSYGYDREELLGLSLKDLRAPETLDLLDSQMAEAGSRGILLQTLHRRKDGRTFPVEVSSQGATLGDLPILVSIIRDITVRKRTEEALQQKQVELLEAQGMAHIGSWVWDAETDVTTGSDELLRIYGFDPATQAMPDFREQRGRCYPVPDWERINAAVEETLRTGVGYRLDVQAFRDGEAIWVATHGEAVLDAAGRVVGLRGTVQDITERVRAAEFLRESEERYRSLVETVQVAIFVNRNNRIDYANPAACTLFGVHCDQLVGRSPYDFVHPDFHATMTDRIRTVLSGGSVSVAETRIVQQNGAERVVEVTAAAFVDPGGTAIQVMMQDITQRQKATDALRESEARFRTLADAMPQLCWMAHPDGWIFWYNERWYGYTGGTPEEMQGWGWQSVHDPDVLPEVMERWLASVRTGEAFEMEFPLRGSDGVYRPFLTRVLPVTNAAGEVLRWFGTNTDISALKQVEGALRASERRYSALFDNKINGMAHCRVIPDEKGHPVDYRILQINDAYERIIGIKKGDIEGRRVKDVFPDIERYAFDYIGTYGRIALEGGEIQFEEFFEATGQYLSIYAYSPLPGEFIAIFSDVTERKWAEQELQRVNDELESRVKTRTEHLMITLEELSREIAERRRVEDDLVRALEAAKTANSTITRLVRTVAHEFRTPLGLLTGSADILDRYWDRLSPEKRLEQNDKIRNASRQMAHLVDSVLTFQPSGTQRKARQLRDIGTVCRSIAAEVEAVWGAGHRFDVSIANGCGLGALDEDVLRRVLQNLLSNAFRYTSPSESVSLCVCRKAAVLHMQVADRGIGIPQEDQALVFDAFYRSWNVEGRRGLGLGLSIVKESLLQIGGSITVESSVGTGTTMRVKLPLEKVSQLHGG